MRFYLVDKDGELLRELFAKSSWYPEIMVPGDFVELYDEEGWFAYYDIIKRGFVSHPGENLAYVVVYHVRKVSEQVWQDHGK